MCHNRRGAATICGKASLECPCPLISGERGEFMALNIVVLGAGAIGGYFGGRLAEAGASVTLLVRDRRYEQLVRRGLRIESLHGTLSIRPRLARHAGEIPSPDLVIVAVKNYHLDYALPALRELVDRGARVLPLLNGVEHVEVLSQEFGVDRVLGGLCYIEATLSPDGDVIHTGELHDVVFGPVGNIDATFVEELASWFRRASVPATVSSHIVRDLWQKYVFLTTMSGITAAMRLSIGLIRADGVSWEFLHHLIAETTTIARRRQPGLPKNLAEVIEARFQSLPSAMTSSLHRDLEKGLPLELESLHGAMVRMAQDEGVDAPHLRAIYALLHPYVDGPPVMR